MIILAFLGLTLPFIECWPPWQYDESWQASLALSLAQEGVLSTPLFGDVFGFAQGSYDRMPIFTVIQSAAIRTLGDSMMAFRLPSVLFGILMIVFSWLLCAAWMSKWWAFLCAALLAFGPLCFVEPPIAPGLTSFASIGRHDAAVAGFALVAAWAILRASREPSFTSAAIAGVAIGLALSTHLYALAVVPGVFAFWLWDDKRQAWSMKAVTAASAAVLPLAWLIWVALHWETSWPQLAAFNGEEATGMGRFNFLSPGFYLSNLANEPSRYRSLSAALPLPFLAAGLGALGIACMIRERMPEARLCLCWLASGTVMFALFDSFKIPAYLGLLAPFAAMAVASGARWMFRHARWGFAIAAFMLALSAGLVSWQHLARCAEEPSFGDVAKFLKESSGGCGSVVGSMRFWPALSDRRFYDYQAPTLRSSKHSYSDKRETVEQWFRRIRPDCLLIDSDWMTWAFALQTGPYADPLARRQLAEAVFKYSIASKGEFGPYGKLTLYRRKDPLP